MEVVLRYSDGMVRDVAAFHAKFGVPIGTEPRLLSEADWRFRSGFLLEELTEFNHACAEGDLPGAADALVDLVYVALGTAVWMGLPWQALWNEVQRANMAKVAASSVDASRRSTGRSHSADVCKPEGWRPPAIAEVLASVTRATGG